MNTRARKLTRANCGKFRPYVGWKLTPDGQRRQHRFSLGRDERVAQARYSQIQALYERVTGGNPAATWTPETLAMAEAIAKGEPVQAPPFSGIPGDTVPPSVRYRQWIDHHRETYPMANIQPDDPDQYSQATTDAAEKIQEEIEQLRRRLDYLCQIAQAQMPQTITSGTLHEAIDKYKTKLERDSERLPDGKLKPYTVGRIEAMDRLKSHHDDCPLDDLTFDRIDQIISYWRNRPVTKKGTRSSRHHAKHQIDELVAFLSWCDSTSDYAWTAPKNLDKINRSVIRLPEDRKKAVVSKPIYSIEELTTISQHATQWERLSLICGLNLAAGAAELGRITADDILLHHQHEYAERLNFTSTSTDSFVRTYRPKTDVFSEHLLWPETVEMLQWGIERAKNIGSKLIWCRNTGTPLYGSAKNAQAAFANMWGKLLDRVQKDEPDFRRLPFGTLRDTLPDMLRHRYSDSLASIALAHGTPSADTLLECYSNRPYGQLHQAIRELHSEFLPILQIKA